MNSLLKITEIVNIQNFLYYQCSFLEWIELLHFEVKKIKVCVILLYQFCHFVKLIVTFWFNVPFIAVILDSLIFVSTSIYLVIFIYIRLKVFSIALIWSGKKMIMEHFNKVNVKILCTKKKNNFLIKLQLKFDDFILKFVQNMNTNEKI